MAPCVQICIRAQVAHKVKIIPLTRLFVLEHALFKTQAAHKAAHERAEDVLGNLLGPEGRNDRSAIIVEL